jgi:hypothetical protein
MIGSKDKFTLYSSSTRTAQPMKAETRSAFGRTTMKELIRQYLNNGISRRDLMRGLGAAGLTASAAKTIV